MLKQRFYEFNHVMYSEKRLWNSLDMIYFSLDLILKCNFCTSVQQPCCALCHFSVSNQDLAWFSLMQVAGHRFKRSLVYNNYWHRLVPTLAVCFWSSVCQTLVSRQQMSCQRIQSRNQFEPNIERNWHLIGLNWPSSSKQKRMERKKKRHLILQTTKFNALILSLYSTTPNVYYQLGRIPKGSWRLIYRLTRAG